MSALTPLGRISSRKSDWGAHGIVWIGVMLQNEAIVLRDTDIGLNSVGANPHSFSTRRYGLLYIGRDAQGMVR